MGNYMKPASYQYSRGLMKHKHIAINNKRAKEAIGLAAEKLHIDRTVFTDRFTNYNDIEITNMFWNTLWEVFPESQKYNDISLCRGCNKFDLNTVN